MIPELAADASFGLTLVPAMPLPEEALLSIAKAS